MSGPVEIIVWRGGQSVSRSQFDAEARQLAGALPKDRALLNLCQDRYRFLLALAAAGMVGARSLLPTNSDAITDDQAAFRLDDAGVDALRAAAIGVPRAAQPAVTVYTSGSSGQPQAHPKSWPMLIEPARRAAARLFDGTRPNIVATVPSQHMYGLETTAIWALAGLAAIHDGRPFYPQDIAAALAEIPLPRLLVTVPLHLRALVAAGIVLPTLHGIVCATAPLSDTLAAEAEAQFGCPVREIYGCTEAASVATRRTTGGPAWQLHADTRLDITTSPARLVAPWLPEPVPLHDQFALQDDGCFSLLGRSGDLLKVGGKRTSLAELTQTLLALPGVVDAVVFMPDDDVAARPAALVVAPGLSTAQIRDQLASRIDALFLPRPLHRVDRLPRSDSGKLPLRDLRLLLVQASS
ncbi:AMP-binding protein [Nevskia sp.]|uniref:AMP-binding protein n=1 Tax=Nevskia sp. TaxID=1929292 RepID=UPI0025EAE692|nr:AMP-binding protein [Nevskia sp.]